MPNKTMTISQKLKSHINEFETLFNLERNVLTRKKTRSYNEYFNTVRTKGVTSSLLYLYPLDIADGKGLNHSLSISFDFFEKNSSVILPEEKQLVSFTYKIKNKDHQEKEEHFAARANFYIDEFKVILKNIKNRKDDIVQNETVNHNSLLNVIEDLAFNVKAEQQNKKIDSCLEMLSEDKQQIINTEYALLLAQNDEEYSKDSAKKELNESEEHKNMLRLQKELDIAVKLNNEKSKSLSAKYKLKAKNEKVKSLNKDLLGQITGLKEKAIKSIKEVGVSIRYLDELLK